LSLKKRKYIFKNVEVKLKLVLQNWRHNHFGGAGAALQCSSGSIDLMLNINTGIDTKFCDTKFRIKSLENFEN
jgi:hypothetical protein